MNTSDFPEATLGQSADANCPQDNKDHFDRNLVTDPNATTVKGGDDQRPEMIAHDHFAKSEQLMAAVIPYPKPNQSADTTQQEQQRGPKQLLAGPPTVGTFEKSAFAQLLAQYNEKHSIPPTVEFTQAYLMASNIKEAGLRVGALSAGGSTSFLKNELVGDYHRMMDSITSVSRVLGNVGQGDLASNFVMEQKNMARAFAKESREVRDLLEEKIVDGSEYARLKERIAEAKARSKILLDDSFTSDEDQKLGKLSTGSARLLDAESSLTQEDSERAEHNRIVTEKRIQNIIKTLRADGQEFLHEQGDINAGNLSLSKLVKKLSKNKDYRKRREAKSQRKDQLAGSLSRTAEQLKHELKKIDDIIRETHSLDKSKEELQSLVLQYEQVLGLDKRVCADTFDKSIAEVDQQPLNFLSYEIQNFLFDFCGLSAGEDSLLRRKPLVRDLLGNIKKVPLKSTLLSSFLEQDKKIAGENSLNAEAKRKNHELVKPIGLEPEKLCTMLDKYKVVVSKIPKFSNIFERPEPMQSNVNMTSAGQVIVQSMPGGNVTFARIDGRSVISLSFNPYTDKQTDPANKSEYEQALKEIQDQRDRVKQATKTTKEKQEQVNIKRAWLNIVKKDIPKAYRQYLKFKTDQENNIKKQTQNCLKEVRKKALKTQRLQKESSLRAKKLTKDMMTFWKKRDKEITDLKRRKEKVEKELRRRLEEEREAILQKKRLEFIMQQSEIYAHFMSKKLGLSDELQKQKQHDMEDENGGGFQRLDIDEQEARHNIASMINDNRSRVNDFDHETQQRKNHVGQLEKIRDEELEVDKFDNPDAAHSTVINPPKCFLGHLKEYQLKGLRWLDNLYEQGINGILADEMGLGKTIQAIALLAHLYENKGVWGPFLIIVPCTVLSNWQNELQKFCPSLKVLPFFGSPEERKKLGKFLDPKNLYNPNMRINILLTSYNLIVNQSKDQQKLLRVKWHYMILDEAQAIKNNLSRRWKVLLQFNTRNRLLLTGTPIQNSMAELWALLHFIMPRLFDSHEQFQEWFSKDIEQHSLTDQGEINKHQLRRLHLVLKPFMLRRLKDDIELEIGPKTEYTHTCTMTHRQRVLYQRIKNKISTKDLFQLVESKAKMENLMNLVMQFRKVCNHPELFERRIGNIPLTFKELQVGMQPNPLFSAVPDLRTQMKNPIAFELPKLIFDECFLITDNQTRTFKKIGSFDDSLSCVSIDTHMKFFNIFSAEAIHRGALEANKDGTTNKSIYSAIHLFAKGNKISDGQLSWLCVADPAIKQIALMHFYHQKYHRNYYKTILSNEETHFELTGLRLPNVKAQPIDLNIVDFCNRDYTLSSLYRDQVLFDASTKKYTFLPPLITDDFNTFTGYSMALRNDLDSYVSVCVANPIRLTCASPSFIRFMQSITASPMHKKALMGSKFKPKHEIYVGRIGRDKSSFLEVESAKNFKNGPPSGYDLFEKGIIHDIIKEKGASIIELPNYSRLVTDCAKMRFLDKLLTEKAAGNHRVLIFCQMTKMLDILEDFLCWRKYTYFRMDGSTNLQDRRFMVEEFQKNSTIFAFLLSTRAGGLGVNLTAADTVIFYDNDWNPTIDAQAQDRAHRIGQTKPVSVIRIITKGTVEEKIVKRAKQKQTVQSTVYGGNALKADVFRAKDVVDMLLDDEEEEDLKDRQQKFLRTRRVKKKSNLTEGDTQMIDTSIAAFRKEQLTPYKPGRQSSKANDANPDAMNSKAKQKGKNGSIKQVNTFFTSVKQGNQSFNGPQAAAQLQNGDEYMDGEDDELDEEDLERQKLFELLDNDDQGMAIEYMSGEEADGKPNGKAGAGASSAANAQIDEEDEDMMGDDY